MGWNGSAAVRTRSSSASATWRAPRGPVDGRARRHCRRGPPRRRASRAGSAACDIRRRDRGLLGHAPRQRAVTRSPASRKTSRSAAAASSPSSDQVLAAMSPVQQPSGVVAIARARPADVRVVMATVADLPLVLVLAGLQDPGNVGAIVRAAAAFGASGVVAIEGSANPFGWKALRGAMGGTFRLPIAARGSLSDVVDSATELGVRLVAAVPRGGTPLPKLDLREPTAIVLGGEGAGVPHDDHGGGARDGHDSDAAAGRVAQRGDRRRAHPLRSDAAAASRRDARPIGGQGLMDLFADDEPPVVPRRARHHRSHRAARRTDASPHPRRHRRAGRAPRRRAVRCAPRSSTTGCDRSSCGARRGPARRRSRE